MVVIMRGCQAEISHKFSPCILFWTNHKVDIPEQAQAEQSEGLEEQHFRCQFRKLLNECQVDVATMKPWMLFNAGRPCFRTQYERVRPPQE
jgi:hypothetical protein